MTAAEWQAMAARITATPEFAALPFHPLAGQIHGDRQYFFDGSCTAFPWGDDDLHRFIEWVKGASEPQELLPFMRVVSALPPNAVSIGYADSRRRL